MDGSSIPFLQDTGPAATQAPSEPRLTPQEVERRARAMALDVDRRLAREQPDPAPLPSLRGDVPEPVVTGTTTLPFHSTLVDPARITGARNRYVKGVKSRILECAACEYRKLETRLGDPASVGVDAAKLTPGQLQHFGPGERQYNLCHTCYDTVGTLHPVLYDRLQRLRMREDRQRTFRNDPAFFDIADRVIAVDSWRKGVAGAVDDLGASLRESRGVEGTGPAPAANDHEEYDGRDLDDRVPRLSDFSGQPAGEGNSLRGNADPLFTNHDAQYDPARVGADETAAYIADERWEAQRKENFRRAWARTDEIEDRTLRQETRARLVERWDPRMALSGVDKMVPASPFAEREPRLTPWARSAVHSGVDEGLSSEPEWKVRAAARHEAAVRHFLGQVQATLERRGLPHERIRELTALPELNPSREIGRFRHEQPLHQRIEATLVPREPMVQWTTAAGKTVSGRVVLPTKAELDAVVASGEIRRTAMEQYAGAYETAGGDINAATFLHLAHRVRLGDEIQGRVRDADAQREHLQRWTSALRRVDQEVESATRSFANEIRSSFRDPKAFHEAFVQLSDDQKRHALTVLRERPAEFATEFRTGFGRDFGDAGTLAVAGQDGRAASGVVERVGVLTAAAGERYLNAIGDRRIVGAHAARDLGLGEGARLSDLRTTCAERLAAANRTRATALRERDTLGPVPTRSQLSHAFTGLHQEDRRAVLKEIPGVKQLIGDRRRELARPGLAL